MISRRKVALVTGSARGIGYAVASMLNEEGYAVVGMDMIEPEYARSVQKTADSAPFLSVKGDITLDQDRKDALDRIDKAFGRLDVLVNNAGVAPKKRMDILETTEESMDFVLGINLKGTFFLTQLAANYMTKLVKMIDGIKPKIINISSVSAYASSTQRAEYCISKAGVSMVTALFADRLAEYGINVYEIRPGIIRTDMTAPVETKYDRLIEDGITPIKRWGLPQDIAGAVSAICSGKLDFCTGEVINVDGGFHLRRL